MWRYWNTWALLECVIIQPLQKMVRRWPVSFFVILTQTTVNLEEEPQFRKWPHQIALKASLGDIILIKGWYGKSQPTLDSAFPGQMVLGHIFKSKLWKPVITVPPWFLFLFQFLPSLPGIPTLISFRECVSSFSGLEYNLRVVRRNAFFLRNASSRCFWSCFVTAIKTLRQKTFLKELKL